MATFNSPTTNTDTITNPAIAGGGEIWSDENRQWGQNPNTWQNPNATIVTGVTADVSVVVNAPLSSRTPQWDVGVWDVGQWDVAYDATWTNPTKDTSTVANPTRN